MRLLITGGRYYNDRSIVWSALDKLNAEGISHLAHGACPTGSPDATVGADWLADAWALENGFKVGETLLRYYADWYRYGPAAGPIRIVKMFDEFKPELALAFPGDRGTARTIAEAKKRAIEVRLGEEQ